MKVILLTLVAMCTAVPPAVEGASCDTVPIEQWAGSPSGLETELWRPVGMVVVTHTDTSSCTTDEECKNISTTIRNSDLETGSKDIKLSFLVGGNGKIYEGAGWKVGGHTTGYNDKSISLSFIGNFTEVIPADAALAAAEEFLDCSVSNQYLSHNYIVLGQRQLISTLNPGNALQNLLQTWRNWSLYASIRPH